MSAITHEIIVKKPYKIVKQILEPHYNNSSQIECEYKFVNSELEISLVSNKPKETEIIVSFSNSKYSVIPNMKCYVSADDLRHTQTDTDKKN